MADTVIWKPGTVGDWLTAANWVSGFVPGIGDTVVIGSGTAIIRSGDPAIAGEAIVLGGSEIGSPVTLEAINATFIGSGEGATEVNTTLTVTGGKPTGSTVEALFLVEGSTSFDGQIFVESIGGSLTIDAESDGTNPGVFRFLNTDLKATIVVSQESFLAFQGETFDNQGLIQIEGGADIAYGVTFTGTRTQPGTFLLENGGQLSVEGSVDANQQIDFFDGTGKLTINNLSGFKGVIGFVERPASGGESIGVAGGRIDLSGVQAQSVQFVQGPEKTGTLKLYAGPDKTGAVVAQLTMQMVSVKLEPTKSTLKSADFQIASDGEGGTLVTYAPQGPTYLDAALPVPVIDQTGSMVSLSTILAQSFGTETPWSSITNPITLIPPKNVVSTFTDQAYWELPEVRPGWYVNGTLITGSYVVQPDDDVELQVGNNIGNPAQIQVQVTKDGTGTSAEFITYNVWTVAPNVAQLVSNLGAMPGTPADVIASALAYNAIFPDVPNTTFCNWIADDVAAAAGAPMPLPNTSLDPSLNVEGGFWRIVYDSTGTDPVADWSTLVQPGDIVRMGWFKPEDSAKGRISGHSTTVLSTVNANGQILFYDNVDYIYENVDQVPSPSTSPIPLEVQVEVIGTHYDNYWLRTNPQDITIYRLDPNQQYLIQGTSLSEVIHGSVYNNLIRPGGGADVITAGAGNNEIQDTAAHLNGITVTDFHFGDSFDFTDLDPCRTVVTYCDGELHVFERFKEVAAIALPPPAAGLSFVVSPDGEGGTTVELAPDHGSAVSQYVRDLLAHGESCQVEHRGIGTLVSQFVHWLHDTSTNILDLNDTNEVRVGQGAFPSDAKHQTVQQPVDPQGHGGCALESILPTLINSLLPNNAIEHFDRAAQHVISDGVHEKSQLPILHFADHQNIGISPMSLLIPENTFGEELRATIHDYGDNHRGITPALLGVIEDRMTEFASDHGGAGADFTSHVHHHDWWL